MHTKWKGFGRGLAGAHPSIVIVFLLELLVVGIVFAGHSLATTLVAAVGRQPEWIDRVIQNAIGLSTIVVGAVITAVEASRMASAALKKSKEKLRAQNGAFFSQVNSIVDRMLEVRR